MLVESLIVLMVVYFLVASLKSGKELRKNKEEILRAKANKIKEIRVDNKLYDVTDWVHRHPGGKIIEFYTNQNEDASIAIQQFHHRSAKKVEAILKSFKSRPLPENTVVTEKDLKNQELSEDFYKLFKELQDEGKFEPSMVFATLRITELICLALLGMYLLLQPGNIAYRVFGIILLSLLQIRAGFLMHESGHNSITGSPKVDRIITSLCQGMNNGLSGSWWRNQHNRHHAMPQRLDHDVDLDTLPTVAFNVKVMKGKMHLYNFWMKNQEKVLIPLLAFVGNLRWKFHLNPLYAFRQKQYVDLLAIAINFYCGYQIGFLNYMLTTAIYTSAQVITFSMSHSHLPVTEEPNHWVEYCTIHTMNVNPSWWCDYWMGYLNYQIEHHMFPTMPQFRLRSISGRVKALVLKHNLPYVCESYGTAFGKVFSNLAEVAKEIDKQARLGQ